MWQFTGKGDSGDTHLFNGKKVKKSAKVLELIGGLDELTAFIGLAISENEANPLATDLAYIQNSLSKLMGIIAGANSPSLFDFDPPAFLQWIEEKIKAYSTEIFNPKAFTFPGKTKVGSALDVCRAVTRRVERTAVGFSTEDPGLEADILTVINRLSSLFYILRLHVDGY